MTYPYNGTTPADRPNLSERTTTSQTNIAGVSTVTSTPGRPHPPTPTEGTLAQAEAMIRDKMGLTGNDPHHPGTPEAREAPHSVREGTPAPLPPQSAVRNPGETTHNPGGSYK